MRKLLTLWIALAAIVGISASSFGGSMTLMGVGKPAAVGGACAGWTPATPSGLVGWYNADSANVSPNTNGATVTVMTDLSSGGHNTAPNGFTGPTYNTTGLGGKPSLDFTAGFVPGMRTTADVVTLGTGSTASVFMLAQVLSSSVGGPYISGNGQQSTPASSANSFIFVPDGSVPDIHANQISTSYTSEAISLNTEVRIGFIGDGTNGTPYVNNVAGTPAAHSFSFTTPGTLGASIGGFGGSIRELIFYNTALGSSDQSCMDAYLVSRQ
jgi:hypothetical protein